VVAGKSFAVGGWEYDDLVLQVTGGLPVAESGGFHQLGLQRGYRQTRLRAPLREAVVYDGRHGGPYAGNLRALHEELLRREAPVEHLWVVSDDAWAVPDTARVLRDGSAAHYEACATARYVFAEGAWREWFAARPDQVCVQTGFATPLKRMGSDLADRPRLTRDVRRWQHQDPMNTRLAVSGGPFATTILSRVLPLADGGELLETGAPAHDLVMTGDREAIRARLEIPPDRIVVLYAPTYRDNLRAKNGYWLGPMPDLDALREALSSDHVLLVRKHWSVVDPVPFDPTGFVRDVSRYPDVSDLLVAADVVVSDYSSLLVQQAAAGRPTVMFAPDLNQYRDTIRGLYVEDPVPLPGPVVAATADLIATVRDRAALAADHGHRIAEFAAVFCPLADGKSAARVIDRVMR
jgi:CDP-glycerol glycerophosphotransferase